MPFASNSGTRIHYVLEGQGPSLVLLHGFRDSGEGWREWGYVQALQDSYRLVLVDARGHGKSDKPHDADAYTIDKTAGDIVAVLDDLGLPKAHFWGYSMGGRIGFCLARHYPHRLNSLIIGGMNPNERTGQGQGRNRMLEILMQGMDAVLAWRESSGRPLTPSERAVLMANDHLALAACFQSTLQGPGFSDILAGIQVPCFFYGGTEDAMFHGSFQEWASKVHGARTHSLEGQDHGGAFDRSDLIVPHVKAFLSAIPAS
ncbi:MAG: alpha/beta fold hydrolase [Chloroflexi bacterium]|nr:alpha/beta fold hydrolase [Chloroflexota bacterium]